MIEFADDDVLVETPQWLLVQAKAIGDDAALVMISGDPEPELLADLDQARVGRTMPACAASRRCTRRSPRGR